MRGVVCLFSPDRDDDDCRTIEVDTLVEGMCICSALNNAGLDAVLYDQDMNPIQL